MMEIRLPGLVPRNDFRPADNYTVPRFPSLYWPLQDFPHTLRYISDIWRFTFLWTIIIYAIFHLGATCVAFMMQIGKRRSNWKYMWIVPIVYAFMAGFEAMFAGSVVGLIIGALYIGGHVTMSTWIPFILGWINLLVMVISSFSIQGGL